MFRRICFVPRPLALVVAPVAAAFGMSAMAAVGAIAVPAPAVAQQRTGTLAQVQQHLRGVNTMVADFAQTDRNGRTLNGTMTLKRPGRIRFQYERGVPQLIVADGRSLYFIDYQVAQVQRWPIGNSPLSVLLDPNRDIARFARILPTNGRDTISVEVHDPAHPEYGRITMVFQRSQGAPGGLVLQGWVALDSQNNRTTVRLSNQRINQPVADSAFRWRDPRPQRPGGPR